MENASKALLIAGAMLLFILLSSLAVYVFTKTRDKTSEIYNVMLSSDVDEFNQKFLNYEDKILTIQDVVSIINLAKDCNESEKMPTVVKVIAESTAIINGISETNLLSSSININNILSANIENKYKFNIEYDENSNLIETITIKKE